MGEQDQTDFEPMAAPTRVVLDPKVVAKLKAAEQAIHDAEAAVKAAQAAWVKVARPYPLSAVGRTLEMSAQAVSVRLAKWGADEGSSKGRKRKPQR
jgi:hypothetical protein